MKRQIAGLIALISFSGLAFVNLLRKNKKLSGLIAVPIIIVLGVLGLASTYTTVTNELPIFAASDWVATDDFESYTPGASLDGGSGGSGWGGNWSIYAGTVTIATSTVIEGTKSALIPPGASAVLRDLTSIASGEFYGSIRTNGLSDDALEGIRWTFDDSAGTRVTFIQFLGDGDIQIRNGAANTSIGSYSANTDFEFGIRFEAGGGGFEGLSADTFKVNLDGAGWSSAYSFDNAVSNIDEIDIITINEPIYSYWFDNIRPSVSLTPTVTTQAVSSISTSSAVFNGTITDDGDASSTHRGFVWDTSTQSAPGDVAPSASGYASTTNESGTFGEEAFDLSITDLLADETYYVRAYASSTAGFGYGDEVNFTSSSSGSVTLTDIATGTIIQRYSDNKASTTVSGTYSGSPTAIQARVINATTSAEVKTWTTIDDSPTGNTFSGTLTEITQGGMYQLQVRFSNNTSIVDNGENVFGVGIVIGLIGQSNIEKWDLSLAGDTPNQLARFWGDGLYSDPGGEWVMASGTGMISFTNSIISANAVPVGIIKFARGAGLLVGSADPTNGYWLDLTPGKLYPSFIAGVASSTGVDKGYVEFVLWGQGESDAKTPETENGYKDGLDTLIARLYSDLYYPRYASGSLPIIIQQLGRYTTAPNDADWQGIRNAQNTVISENDNVYLGATTMDLPLSDGIHYTVASYGKCGNRMAQTINYILGTSVYYRGITHNGYEEISTSIFDMHLTHSGGSDFTPTTSITGFEITDNGSGETITSAVRQDATTIRLTIAGSITGSFVVKYMYGADPVATAPVIDNTSLQLPLEPSESISVYVPPATVYPTIIYK